MIQSWRRGVVVITIEQRYPTKSQLKFCEGSNLARRVGDMGW